MRAARAADGFFTRRALPGLVAEALDPSLRPALSRRAAAFLVDAALVALYVAFSVWASRTFLGPDLQARFEDGSELYRWDLLTLSIPVWAYFVVGDALRGGTLGKRLLGLEVRPVDAPRVGVNASFRRTAVKLFPYELIHVGLLVPQPLWTVQEPNFRWPLMLGALLVAWSAMRLVRSPARQGPWDRAAGTVVVRRDRSHTSR